MSWIGSSLNPLAVLHNIRERLCSRNPNSSKGLYDSIIKFGEENGIYPIPQSLPTGVDTSIETRDNPENMWAILNLLQFYLEAVIGFCKIGMIKVDQEWHKPCLVEMERLKLLERRNNPEVFSEFGQYQLEKNTPNRYVYENLAPFDEGYTSSEESSSSDGEEEYRRGNQFVGRNQTEAALLLSTESNSKSAKLQVRIENKVCELAALSENQGDVVVLDGNVVEGSLGKKFSEEEEEEKKDDVIAVVTSSQEISSNGFEITEKASSEQSREDYHMETKSDDLTPLNSFYSSSSLLAPIFPYRRSANHVIAKLDKLQNSENLDFLLPLGTSPPRSCKKDAFYKKKIRTDLYRNAWILAAAERIKKHGYDPKGKPPRGKVSAYMLSTSYANSKRRKRYPYRRRK